MKAFLAVGLALTVLGSAGHARKPNVLIIYTDDQGSIDLNCYGAEDLTTPHMDGLAEKGVRFTQFYTASPICSPSRAALLTGRYPHRAQRPGNSSSQPGGHGMPSRQVTIAEVFKEADYQTGLVGKWHLGYDEGMYPNDQGFDYFFGHLGGCIDNYSHFFYWVPPNRHDLWRNKEEIWRDGEFFGDLIVEESQQFITSNKEKPWLLYLAINFPHYPLQGTGKWRDHYKGLPHPRDKYAAFVSTMDEMIGEVVKHIEELGLAEDTIIVFQSDHGHSTESRTFGGGGNNGPYRGAKGDMFEGGIRIPAIISWPGHLPEGEVRDQMAANVDWLPTLAELAGVELPGHRIDGVSIVPIIKSNEAADAHEEFHWELGNRWAARKGDWKLLGNPRDSSHDGNVPRGTQYWLADLSRDIGEEENLAEARPEKVKELQELHDRWVADRDEQ